MTTTIPDQESPKNELLSSAEREKYRVLCTLIPEPARQLIQNPDNAAAMQSALSRVEPNSPAETELRLKKFRYVGISVRMPEGHPPELTDTLRQLVDFELTKILPAWIIPQGEKDTLVMNANENTLPILRGFAKYILPEVVNNFFADRQLEPPSTQAVMLSVGEEAQDGLIKAIVTQSNSGLKNITVGQYFAATPHEIINPALTPSLMLDRLHRGSIAPLNETQLPLLVQAGDSQAGDQKFSEYNSKKKVTNEAFVSQSNLAPDITQFTSLVRQQAAHNREQQAAWRAFADDEQNSWIRDVEAGTFFPFSYFLERIDEDNLDQLHQGETIEIHEVQSTVLPFQMVIGTDVSGMSRITDALQTAINHPDFVNLPAENQHQLLTIREGASNLFVRWQLETMKILKRHDLPLNEIAGDGAKAISPADLNLSVAQLLAITGELADSWQQVLHTAEQDASISVQLAAKWLLEKEQTANLNLAHPGEVFVKTALNITDITIKVTEVGGNFYSLLEEKDSSDPLFSIIKEFRNQLPSETEIVSAINLSVWEKFVTELANPSEYQPELLANYAGLRKEGDRYLIDLDRQKLSILEWNNQGKQFLFVVKVPPGGISSLPNGATDLSEKLRQGFTEPLEHKL